MGGNWIGIAVAAVLVLILLMVWENAANTRAISPLFFPQPSVTARTLAKWFSTTEWQSIVIPTLRRLLIGLAAGATIGYLLGLLMGFSRALARIADPILSIIYPLPKISLLPLALVIFGLGDTPRQVVIGLAAFFPMVLNTMAGIRTINPNYLAIAQVYGARPLTVITRLLLPGSLPLALTGLRIAFNSAFVVSIAIELHTATDGLGHIVWRSWQTLRTEELYAGLVIIATIGVISTALLAALYRRLVRWV
ncbi:MAG: ABC transporter permease [Chloroflexi bacterium]|nr:ABC transporter permease [Chloroflexota bacterium]